MALSACQLVFSLEEPVPQPPAPPDAFSDAPAACAHDGLRLCVAFEAEDPDIDSSPAAHLIQSNAVRRVGRPINGVLEGAIDLDSESLMVVRENSAFDLSPPFAFDLWVFAVQPEPQPRLLFDNSLQYSLLIFDNVAACYFFIEGNFSMATAPLTFGSWVHVACVHDGMTGKAYVDGEAGAVTSMLVGPIPSDPDEPHIGSAASGERRPFTGQLDNVRVWERALSPSDISFFARGDEGN